MQYKIPQNIEVEDKVVGPLTLRQFLILLIGAGVLIPLNFMVVGAARPLFYMLAVILAGLTISIAFFDYGGQHVEQILFSAISSISAPRRRIWKKEEPKMQQTKQMTAQEISEMPVVREKRDVVEIKENIAALAREVDASSHEGPGPRDMFQSLPKDNPLEALMKKAKPEKPKEPVMAQLASVSPDKKFEYPVIQTAEQDPLANLKQPE